MTKETRNVLIDNTENSNIKYILKQAMKFYNSFICFSAVFLGCYNNLNIYLIELCTISYKRAAS